MARLIIFDDCVRAVDLPARTVVVGRSLKVDVPIRDRLLSRKHCSLVPRTGSGLANGDGGAAHGFRFSDLKSANGSYVNGVRVDHAELEFDDVIEIGNTVMVLLDTETWERGEGLTRMRNPVKAQELVLRLKHAGGLVDLGAGSTGAGSTGAGSTGAGHVTLAHRDLVQLAGEETVVAWLEKYLEHRIVALLLRRVPGLRSGLSEALERVLVPEVLDGGADLQLRVREAVRTVLDDLAAVPGGARASDDDRESPGRTPSSAAESTSDEEPVGGGDDPPREPVD